MGQNVPTPSQNVPTRSLAPSPGQNVPSGGNVPPTLALPGLAGALAWYDAQNINFPLNNVGIADADPVGTYKNASPTGAAYDLIQAVAGNRPLFRLVASGGTLNGKSAIDSPDAVRFMRTAAFSSNPQRILTADIIRPADFAATYVWRGGNAVGECEFWTLAGTGVVHQYAGADANSALAVTVAKWNLVICDFNGASSIVRVNGVQSGALNPGAGGLAGISLLAEPPSAANSKGMHGESATWVSAFPTYAEIEAYFVAKYGAMPE